MEDRTLLSVIRVNSSSDRPFDPANPDNVLTLRDATLLVNGNLTPNELSAAQQALITGTPNQPGVTDTIDFNVPFNDPGHVYYKDDGNPGSVTSADIVPVPTVAIDGATPITSDSQLADPSLVGAGNTIDPDWSHSWWSIQPVTDLPGLTHAVTIDGYSQAGSSRNTCAVHDNAVLTVELSGQNDGMGIVAGGLHIYADDITVQGLVVNSFGNTGIGVYTNGIGGPTGVAIQGCFIGTDASGTVAHPNGYVGIDATQAPVRVGTNGNGIDDSGGGPNYSDYAEWNIISGNGGYGVRAYSGSVVAGNYIGTDRTGTKALPNGLLDPGHGIGVEAVGARVGVDGHDADPVAERNVISGNINGGVNAYAGSVVAGNYIGLDATGNQPLGNGPSGGTGILLGDNVLVGSDGDGMGDGFEGNVVSGNYYGIFVLGANNHIAGNYIGTDATGTFSIGQQGQGVVFYQPLCHDNVLGYTYDPDVSVSDQAARAAAMRNVISGNLGWGVDFAYGAYQNTIAGNFIGTDLNGTAPVPNGTGIVIGGGNHNLIGTNSDGHGDDLERNIISGNDSNGVLFDGEVDENVVAGNYIGLDVTGTRSLSNGTYGVVFSTSAGVGNRIERNVISTAGHSDGIGLGPFLPTDNLSGTIIAGNYIGTDATGTTTTYISPDGTSQNLGCQGGVHISPIGGAVVTGTEIEGNVIAGCYDGVLVQNGAAGALVEGNWIGTNVNGHHLGNYQGVVLTAGTSTVLGNTIAFSGDAGVFVTQLSTGNTIKDNSIHDNDYGVGVFGGSTGNDIQGNSIHDNGFGIALGTDVWQDSPVLTGVSTGSATWVAGTLRSTPNTTFTIDFYANAAKDPSGYYEGQRYLGSYTTQQADEVSPGNYVFNVPVGAASPGESITATATASALGGNTSEFSQAFQKPTLSPTTTTVTASIASPTYGQPETFTATVTPLLPSDGTPSGTVTFSEGGSMLGTVPVTSSGGSLTASLNRNSLGVGSHTITATYKGDTGFSGSRATTSLVVQQTTANLSVGAAPAEAYTNQPVTFTVTASSPAWVTIPPIGQVVVYDGNGTQSLGSAYLQEVGVGDTASAVVTVRIASAGNHTLTIRGYDGIGNFVFLPCSLSLTVLDGAPPISVGASPSTPIEGENFTLTATIDDSPNGVHPTGTVSFYDGVVLLGTANMPDTGTVGTATLTVPAPAAGPHRIRAIYTDPYGYALSWPANEVTNLGPNVGSNTGSFIATDGPGNVFTAGWDGTTVYKVQSDGHTPVASGFSGILGLAADQVGHLFVEDPSGAVTELRPDGTGLGTAFTPPEGYFNGFYEDLAVDNAGDLFVAYDNGNGSEVIREVALGHDGLLSDGTTTLFAQLDFADSRGTSIAVDTSANVYVWFRGSGRLYEVNPGGAATPIPNPAFGGYNYPAEGIAATPAGDVLLPLNGGFREFHAEGTSVTILGDYSNPTLPSAYPSDLAVDSAGNVYVASQVGVYRIDLTSTNLNVKPLYDPLTNDNELQSLLTQQGGSATIQPTSSAVVSDVVQAINVLSPPPTGTTETFTLDLRGGTFTTDTKIQAPAGVTVVVQNGTLIGGSPALVVNSGNVILKNVTASNATNAPTIVLNGGSLKVRNSTIQESTSYAQAAIQVNGGTVDLGTAADPGNNSINVNGSGALIQNLSGRSIPAIGDILENNGVALSSAPSIYILNPTASGALAVSNNANINIPGVVIVESTSATAVSAGNKTTLSAWASGLALGTPDPLAGLTGPSLTDSSGAPLPNYSSFVLGGNSKGSYTINPGIYSQINISGGASVTLNPGVYIIKGGGIAVSGGASVTGAGVMIYNAGSNYPSSGGNFGGVTLSGSGTFNLSAPTSGPYAGILIFQSHQNTRALSISGSIMTGMYCTIYAAKALLSLSGGAQLQSLLDVGMLSVSGGAALTQMADGTDGTGDTSGIANTLVAGNLNVYINDPGGLFTADELARIQDAINTWDTLLAPYNVTISEVSEPTLANMVIDIGTSSACGGMSDGVLGCFNAPNSEITMIQGWDWYDGSDPSQIGAGQYDFETTVLHELGHALGLGGSTNPTSPMYETLAAGVADRAVTTLDLNIPDPPEDADPQVAAGFRLDTTTPALPANSIAAPGSAPIPFPAGLVPLPPAGAPATSPATCSLFSQTAMSVQAVAISQASPASSLVSQGADLEDGRGLTLTGIRAGLVLDSALADLAAGADRWRGAQFPRSATQIQEGRILARSWTGSVSDGVLEDLAANAAESRGRKEAGTSDLPAAPPAGIPKLQVPGDSSAQKDRPEDRGGVLARLAVTFLAAGLWGHGAGIGPIRTRRSRRLRHTLRSN
jgi:titin